jgi:hypothetical protein
MVHRIVVRLTEQLLKNAALKDSSEQNVRLGMVSEPA